MNALHLVLSAVALTGGIMAQDCGQTPIKPNLGSRIVNGEDAVPHSWPWQVALCIKGSTDPKDCQLNCGGSIINKQWIVTAGHCGPTTTNSNYLIKIGAFNIRDKTEEGVIVAEVEKQVRNPAFNTPRQLGHDITLIKLKTPIEYSDRVQPVCLATTDDDLKEGDIMYTTGWGRLTGGGALPPKLQQVSVGWLSRATCAKEDTPHLFDETKVCVGGASNDEGACNGDSGGPLVRQKNGKWTLYGITSYKSTGGFACVGDGHPRRLSRATCPNEDTPCLFDKTKVCVGGASNDEGACNGDSGAPLVLQKIDKS